MCTVTYIRSAKNSFLTASRDEQRERPAALSPDIHLINGQKILFPQDPVAGGTWFAINEQGAAVIFLNGAVTKHQPQPVYRKSRGLILLDLISSLSVRASFEGADLEGIAPFTAIVTEPGNLFVARWDGTIKSWQPLDADRSYIWSSVTLYEPEAIQKRQLWFDRWIAEHPGSLAAKILDFHLYAGDGDPQNDIRMNRNDQLFTHSICSAQLTEGSATVQYLDLQQMKTTKSAIRFLNSVRVNA